MKKIKSCASCSKCVPVNVNNDMLCRIKGIVSRDFVCTRYTGVPAPENKNDRDPRYRCCNCEFFIQDESIPASMDGLSTIGFCQLFTVRHFDGERKTACSKFSMRQEQIVS